MFFILEKESFKEYFIKRKLVCIDRKWNATHIGGLNSSSVKMQIYYCWYYMCRGRCLPENSNSDLASFFITKVTIKQNALVCVNPVRKNKTKTGIYTTDEGQIRDVLLQWMGEIRTNKTQHGCSSKASPAFQIKEPIINLQSHCLILFDDTAIVAPDRNGSIWLPSWNLCSAFAL